ncbi:hypothetical protein [Microbacterium gorillae]|uniref:hypothetical protein n=1 Tax=Microbacterium gorillae TaxID=1231063 RepID=UPI000A81AE70|nr:hypothetical protein [Microbacterium gorillae]
MADNSGDPEGISGGEYIDIANEFAHVLVRKIYTRNGERLEIIAPHLEKQIRLDPLELEALTWQTTATFSRMLEEPFGTADPEIPVLTRSRKTSASEGEGSDHGN